MQCYYPPSDHLLAGVAVAHMGHGSVCNNCEKKNRIDESEIDICPEAPLYLQNRVEIHSEKQVLFFFFLISHDNLKKIRNN